MASGTDGFRSHRGDIHGPILLLVCLAYSGCTAGPRTPALSAVRFMLGKEQMFDIKVTNQALTIGNRGLEHTADSVSGIMGERVAFREEQNREIHSQGLWRLKRSGSHLVGIVEGQNAKFNVQQADGTLSIQGYVGLVAVDVSLTPRQLTVAVQEMKYDFTLDPAVKKAGLQVFVAEQGRLRLSLSRSALKQTKTSLDMALLMTVIELWAENRRIAFRNRPGWMEAPQEHFDGR